MVICAGPTGSGKTTTLYGSLAEINSPERNIMTIEDPVEYTFPSINQIQINEQAGITFAGGLRSILRQDPDVILVGEVRDVETARIAVQSALTGHFVLSSLHATDSVSALHRLIDMGIETFLIASSVTAVLSQRLVRRICPHCREPYQPTAEELAFLRAIGGDCPGRRFLHGAGCNFCAKTGYLERIGVYEMLTLSDGIRELVLDRASHDELRKLARAEGMSTLLEEAVALVRERHHQPRRDHAIRLRDGGLTHAQLQLHGDLAVRAAGPRHREGGQPGGCRARPVRAGPARHPGRAQDRAC